MTDMNSFKMMALGDFRFSMETAAFKDFDRRTTWRWPAVDRIGAPAAVQYVGPGEDIISLRGVIYPHFAGGLGQIDAMRAEANKGEPLFMVDGTGKVWGYYVITDIREGRQVFFSNGVPRYQEFEITLQYYYPTQEPGPGDPWPFGGR